jgi:N-acetylmuramoyl-L-alanine amidase
MLRLGMAFAAMLCAASYAEAQRVSSISVVGDGEYTRLTLAADAPIAHETVLEARNGARTVVLFVPGASIAMEADTPPPSGAVSSYEILPGQIRLHLQKPAMVTRALDIGPTTSDSSHRLVVDLVRVAPSRFDRAASEPQADLVALASASAETAAQSPDAQTDSGRPHVVVIDPGHGGRDPGASSHDATREKSIVLKTALALKEELEHNKGYTVYLTRSDDTYIEHEDRVSMARNWGADLFISIHADAAGNSSVSGATVYTLSARGERRVDGTASENGWDLPIEDGTTREVSGILADLIKRETKSNSSIFAEMLIPELAKAGPIVRNSHRQENFFVLLAPDVPAALVEIGFLTNRADAKRLSSSDGRRKAAKAIANAINAYFDQQDLIFAVN